MTFEERVRQHLVKMEGHRGPDAKLVTELMHQIYVWLKPLIDDGVVIFDFERTVKIGNDTMTFDSVYRYHKTSFYWMIHVKGPGGSVVLHNKTDSIDCWYISHTENIADLRILNQDSFQQLIIDLFIMNPV